MLGVATLPRIETDDDPDEFLAALIEAVADELPNRDADVIPLPEREEDAPADLLRVLASR